MRITMTSIAALGATLLVTGCAQQEEPVEEVVLETPIYAKDGTIIGTRPTVTPGGSGDGSDMSSIDDDSDG